MLVTVRGHTHFLCPATPFYTAPRQKGRARQRSINLRSTFTLTWLSFVCGEAEAAEVTVLYTAYSGHANSACIRSVVYVSLVAA